jgi:hypothetical protein
VGIVIIVEFYSKKQKNFATYVTIHTLSTYICSQQRSIFFINSEIHNMNTRHNFNLHLVLENFDIY